MKGLTIDFKDLEKLKVLLEKSGPDAKKIMEAELEASANLTLTTAKLLTPVNHGVLRASNNKEKVNPLEWKIGNNQDYAPYVEFGTGLEENLSIAPEWTDFANQFKGSSGESWENGLEEIRKWCINKGIDEKFAYPIFRSILKNGIEAHPFLYPAFQTGRAELKERLTNFIKNYNLEK